MRDGQAIPPPFAAARVAATRRARSQTCSTRNPACCFLKSIKVRGGLSTDNVYIFLHSCIKETASRRACFYYRSFFCGTRSGIGGVGHSTIVRGSGSGSLRMHLLRARRRRRETAIARAERIHRGLHRRRRPACALAASKKTLHALREEPLRRPTPRPDHSTCKGTWRGHATPP